MEDSELLCSPRKIRRLARYSHSVSSTPKHDTQQKFSQGSQESRATSTPTKRSLAKRLSISSEISSINIKASSVLSLSSNESEAANNTSDVLSLLEELSIDGSYNDFSKKPNPRIFRGKTWNYFKPKFEESLYFKVFTNFEDVEDIAFEFLEQLRSDENKGILTVIKFFVDLCGYQSAQIDEHFDFNQDFSISCEKVIKLIEFDLVDRDMLEAKTYIFYESEKRKSNIGVALASATNSFLEKLLIAAHHQNILFTRPFHKCIFHFLFYMCQSVLRPIRHTGITLVRIVLVVLNQIYSRSVKKLPLRDTQSDQDCLPIEKEIKYLEKYLQYFFGIFAKNSFIPDQNLCMLRAKNVLEMGNWMVEIPELYFENCAAHLYKFILDESEVVRLSTIKVWKHLIKTKAVRLHVCEHLDGIVQNIQGRLKDIQLKVVVEAIDFFTVIVDHYPNVIGEHIVCDITELIYASSYLYAKAAAFFTITFLSSSGLTETQILHKLVDLSSISKKMKHFFVEAFAEHNNILQNYKFMMEVLLSCNKETELEFTHSLFELMYHSIHQKLNGEALVKRKDSISVVPSSTNHEEIAKLFFMNLKELFLLFQNQLGPLNHLMKILVLVNYDMLSSKYYPHVTYLMKHSRQLLLHTNNEELLGNICRLFHYLCYEKNYYLKNDMNKYLVSLLENLSIYLQGYLDEPEEQEMALDLHFKKIGKLYEKFNLNRYFQWNNIFTVWGSVPICRGQIMSCNHHILWAIRDLIGAWSKDIPDQKRMKKINLESNFSQFTTSLVHLMDSHDSADNLKLDAFEYFCCLHITSHGILSKEEELGDFKFKILQSLKAHVPGTLVKFFANNIVYHRTLAFERRKKLISDWLGLIFNALTDVLYIIPLFECYHLRFQEYGPLIQFVAATIFARKQEVFFQLILATLSKLASQIFKISFKTLSSPEAAQLLALAVKFANMREFSNASKEILRMLHLGFKLCFKDGLFEILVLLQNFLHKLSEEHYRDCLQIFKAMTPKELENHEFVRSFRVKLEAGKTKGIGKIGFTGENVSTIGNLSESDIPVIETIKRPKRELVREKTTSNSKARKSTQSEDSSKENCERRKSKKKGKSPKSRKSLKKT